jgi:FkbM family methyltransferase
MSLKRVRLALRHFGRAPEIIAGMRAMKSATKIVSAYVGLNPLQLPCTVEFRNGIHYRLEEYYDLETLWQINFHNVYPLQSTDEVILDAGANVGLFTCWAAQRNPTAAITAIEPFPRNIERLTEHIQRNGFSQRVEVIPAALSASVGTASLSIAAEASQMFRLTSGQAPGSVDVPTLRLVDVVERLKHNSIDLMKMDIEGSEYEVLLSTPAATFSRIRRIILEYHQPGSLSHHNKKDLLAYMKSCGYASVDQGGISAEYGMVHFSR